MNLFIRILLAVSFLFPYGSAIGYFATGAAAGIVAPANPALAMQLTAMGNITTDIVSGNMPRLDNPIEITSYIGGKILEGYTTAELGKGIANAFGYVDNISANLTSKGTLEGTIQTTKFSLDGAAKTGSNLVYEGLDAAGKVRYVGITGRDAAVRFGEHLNSVGTGKELLRYQVIKGGEDLSKTQARIWEQTLINQYGLQKNGGLLLNKMNSIAPKNWLQYGIK